MPPPLRSTLQIPLIQLTLPADLAKQDPAVNPVGHITTHLTIPPYATDPTQVQTVKTTLVTTLPINLSLD